VLLDEVGAGTNPLEGAALGMAILESFAESGSLLTMATTHHGELKTLKYRFLTVPDILLGSPKFLMSIQFLSFCIYCSNSAFENACMEFDDLNLKPTYKILWGVPGLATSSSRLFNDRFVYLQNGIRVNMIHQPTFEIACQVGRMQ
jgi:hypothetical protein